MNSTRCQYALLVLFLAITSAMAQQPPSFSWQDTLAPEKRQQLFSLSQNEIDYFARYFDPADTAAIDVAGYRAKNDDGTLCDLPVGVFDSGTGGLAVLEELRKALPASERYIFYADQANMPWGEYPTTPQRTATLLEIMMGVYQFLLTDRYDVSPHMQQAAKSPVKAVVVACNTATAYSVKLAQQVLALGHQLVELPEIPVYGIIDSGAEGALAVLEQRAAGKSESRPAVSIAVLATSGTVDAGAYPVSIYKQAGEKNWKSISVYQQAGIGLAGAIDQMPEYIDLQAGSWRSSYKGPNANVLAKPLDRELWSRLHFVPGGNGNGFFVRKSGNEVIDFQLNSVENYIRLSVVMLLEQMLKKEESKPLAAVILGCTHYPYYQGTFAKVFRELRQYKTDGRYVYRHLLAPELAFIDPSWYLAQTVKQGLAQRHLLRNKQPDAQETEQFYISVPKANLSTTVFVEQNPRRGFTSEYKHGRTVDHGKRVRPETVNDIARVPMGRNNIDDVVARRLATRVPQTFQAMTAFSRRIAETKADSLYVAF
jgi:glutamate racemase